MSQPYSVENHIVEEIEEHLEHIRHPKVEYFKDANRMKDAVIEYVYDEAGYIQDLLNQIKGE